MKNFLFFFLAFCALGFIACETEHDNEHEDEAIDMQALRTEIQGLEDAYAKAQMAKDADGVVAYYADDATSMPPDKSAAVGKAAILALTREDMAADTTGSTIRFEVVDVFAQGNLAVEVGKSISTDANGTESTGKYISVFEMRDGKWICIRDIFNNDAPEQ